MTVAQLRAFYENLETKELYKLKKIFVFTEEIKTLNMEFSFQRT